MHTFRKHGFFWVMLAIFVGSLTAHWVTAWWAYQDDQQEHGQPVQLEKYFIEVTRQTMENWQSEMLQLILQVSLISFLWYVGSPQSRSEEDRLEAKVDWIMQQLNAQEAARLNRDLNERYPTK